jgi:hypothetical protein
MQSIVIRTLSFSSFVKIATLSAFSIGVVLGLLCPVAALFNGTVTSNVFGHTYEGWQAAIINIFWFPLVITLLGALVSTVAYLPFRVALFIFTGLRVTGDFEE